MEELESTTEKGRTKEIREGDLWRVVSLPESRSEGPRRDPRGRQVQCSEGNSF